ncbi:hypothetical protein [uncultured Shewanella sp.]|uniref:hypothetical protein n=1 Tax=uncultured Shewanella sp. TaxID=173975 RepID=UPI00261DD2EA|nr:hypothetical protein [uncultured Shewanella sp.]
MSGIMSSIMPDVGINTSTSMVNFLAEEQQKLTETLIQGILEGIPDSEYIRELKQAAVAEYIQKSQQVSSELTSLSSTTYDFFATKSNTDGHLADSKSTYGKDIKSSPKQDSEEWRGRMQNLQGVRSEVGEVTGVQDNNRF